jgi:manganese transport protein
VSNNFRGDIGSIKIKPGLSWLKKLLAFSGPGYLVAVGYMDPGNWATDLAGGSMYGYQLLSVILISNLMAILLQHLAAKLGIVTKKDLAQACRDYYPKQFRGFLWILAEVAIIACDLAEVIGSAIALQLLFKIPIILGVLITSLDTLLLLFLQNKGLRYLEALIISLIALILGSFAIEIFLARPDAWQIVGGILPSLEIIHDPSMLYIAIGILGATVMPHNLYLHSSLVQSRKIKGSVAAKKEAVKFASLDSGIALVLASFVNAAILILSAAVFHKNGLHDVAEIQDAHKLLSPLLGTELAGILFALALLASGHNSTITGTMAGQIVMEGFVDIKLKSWQRRLLTRVLAMAPAILVILIYGDQYLGKLLVMSQVVLSLQLPFAVIPLVQFTSSRKIMGGFVNPILIKYLAISVAFLITGLNMWLVWSFIN